MPAIGFAIGFDRLAEIVSLKTPAAIRTADLFIAALGKPARKIAFSWSTALGLRGYRAPPWNMLTKALKAQMKRANRLGAGRVLIVGESEMKSGTVVLRDMATKTQQEIPLDTVVEH
jgi:histidyl-tRNA synthetase